MKRIILVITLQVLGMSSFCQDSTAAKKMAREETEKYWQTWIKDLYEVGVEQTKDSIKVSAEVKKIILDSNYRKTIYPAAYTLPVSADLLKRMEIKKAMWYLINMYGPNKESKDMVLKIILPFEQGLEMDKVLISTFYTYAMIDPSVGSLKNGKIVINRPDLLEQKFNTVKEMVGYIVSQRKKPNDNATKAIGATRSEELKNLGKGSA
ncbi:MAG: hypothetical protein JWQ09_5229, partial [Segetibacter sp.]|nr:hypothetical protein [Segetibacter sp.]